MLWAVPCRSLWPCRERGGCGGRRGVLVPRTSPAVSGALGHGLAQLLPAPSPPAIAVTAHVISLIMTNHGHRSCFQGNPAGSQLPHTPSSRRSGSAAPRAPFRCRAQRG